MASLKRLRPYDLNAFLVTVGFAVILFFSLRPATDPDYGWHIQNGRHVFDGVTLSGKDPYSWTAENLWVAHEWVTEALMSLAHDAFGFTANSVIAAIAITAAYGFAFVALRSRGVSAGVAMLTVTICFVGALRSVAVRPHVIELLFFAAAILLVERSIRVREKPSHLLVRVALLALLWVNMHGSFPLLAALLVITSAELAVVKNSAWRSMAAASLMATVMFVFNPWFFHIYSFATQSITSQSTLQSIEEWKAPVLGEWLALPILTQVALALVGLVVVVKQNRNFDPDTRGIPSAIGMLRIPAFAFLAFQSGRHIMLFGVASAFFIAKGLGALSIKRRSRPKDDEQGSPISPAHEMVNAFAAIAVSIAVLIAGWRVISPEAQHAAIEKHFPVAVTPVLARHAVEGDRLLNDYNWGGFLILNTEVPVFIDGRSELYGDAQLNRYASLIHLDPGWNATLRDLGISLVLMPDSSRLAAALDDAGWTTLARDSVGWLLQRPR